MRPPHLVLVDLDAVNRLGRPTVCGTQHWSRNAHFLSEGGPAGVSTHPRSSRRRLLRRTGSRPHVLARSHSARSPCDPAKPTGDVRAQQVRTGARWAELTLSTNLERSVFQVQDVDVVVSRSHNQTVVLCNNQRSQVTTQHSNTTHPKTTPTLELRIMELISGISRLDLKRDPVSVKDQGTGVFRCLTCSLVSSSTQT